MYTRDFNPPKSSYFLFGPRGTGKSTWLRQHYPGAVRIDLLSASRHLRYEADPSLFSREALALPKTTTFILDEIQKAPALLDEVHSLMEEYSYRSFILTGSSARKLKRSGANLLAGRAIMRHFFPLTSHETNYEIPYEQSIRFGCLPLSITAGSDVEREEFLESYAMTYLGEEIRNEALVRNLGSFSRFLEVAALSACSPINFSNLARDCGIGRDTARNYFSILEDTLIGSWLPAFRPRAKIKEVATPKFYWFDSGVLHAMAGGFGKTLDPAWKGFLFETWIHHEMRSYISLNRIKGELSYWGTPSESEIDFMHVDAGRVVAIETKASLRFRCEFTKGIDSFNENRLKSQKLRKSYVVYLGDKELKSGETWILPPNSFLKRLHAGEVLGD